MSHDFIECGDYQSILTKNESEFWSEILLQAMLHHDFSFSIAFFLFLIF